MLSREGSPSVVKEVAPQDKCMVQIKAKKGALGEMLQKISQGSSHNTGALIPGSVHSDIHFTCSHECLGAHISHKLTES